MAEHRTERRHRRPAGLGWLLAAGLAACSDPAVLSVEVTPGQETGTFGEAPAITRVDVTARAPEGDLLLAATAEPGGTFALGEVPETRLLTFEAVGIDVDGRASVRGRSVSLVAGGIEGGVLPLFVGRVGQWARPPSGLLHGRVDAVAAALGERYLMLAGGAPPESGATASEATPEYYDLLSLGAAGGAPLPRVAKSLMMGADGSSAVLIDDAGASWIDFIGGTSTELAVPTGLARFADLAGGRVVEAPNGTRYLVGATRAGAPSDAIVVWEPSQALRAARLAFARQGAAAEWLEGVGLIVVGGHPTAPGLEVLGDGASATATRPYPADPTIGAAAVARSSAQVLLLGGTTDGVAASSRVLDAGCSHDCWPTELEVRATATLTDCRGFAMDPDHLLLVGADQDDVVHAGSTQSGMTRTFVINLIDQQAVELVLREPRAGAAVLATPHGLLALLGGMHRDGSAATSVELLYPESGSQ